jgi:peptide/nickel transport system permease protein
VKTYLLHRALAIIPVMLVVATVSFVLIRLAPGDPASVLAGPDATTEDLAQLRTALGMDQPLPVQLVKWYARLAQGDLGQSIFLRRPVVQAVVERLEPTFLLTWWGTLLSILIGVPAGIVSARYHNTAVDQSFMALALLGLSIPNFLLGLVMILVFGVWLGWLPVSGYVPLDEGVWLNVRSLLMPAVSLGLVQSALVARITRSSMLDVLREQYILSGRAKGLSERAVIYKHALKNAIIPTLTVIGITVALLIGGAVVIETVFNIPGVGRLIISAVLRRDYPVVQGVVLLIAVTYTVINLLVDLAYLVIDPRIRYTG